MKILVSNDDGIDAPGLRALVEVLIPNHEVHVVAPDKERSAMGHALTLHRPLRVERIPQDYFAGAKAVYAVDGTPTDCVKIALNKILNFKPDWILAGINHGPNMGADVLYSGTVSVTVEGAIYGIKSIAFSLSEYRADGFEESAKSVPHVLNLLSDTRVPWPPMTVFNVNLPDVAHNEVKGVAWCKLGERMYKDLYDERIDPRGRSYYWLSGDLLKTDPDSDTDVVMASKHYITVSPLTFNMTNSALLQDLRRSLPSG